MTVDVCISCWKRGRFYCYVKVNRQTHNTVDKSKEQQHHHLYMYNQIRNQCPRPKYHKSIYHHTYLGEPLPTLGTISTHQKPCASLLAQLCFLRKEKHVIKPKSKYIGSGKFSKACRKYREKLSFIFHVFDYILFILLMEEILHQLRLVVVPIIYRVSTSQVVVWDFFHQLYTSHKCLDSAPAFWVHFPLLC